MAWRAGLWPAGRLLHTPALEYETLEQCIGQRLLAANHMLIHQVFAKYAALPYAA